MFSNDSTRTTTPMTTAAQDADYEGFCRMVQRQVGLDLAAYKRNQMERRVRSMAERAGASTLMDYWKVLAQDAQALRTFLDRVTINVSEFFRNPEKFEELRTLVLPRLLSEKRSLFLWSAGCSYGAEPYSLRMLLHQLTPTGRHRILATDVDTGILAKAREGRYTADDVKNVPAELRDRFLTTIPGGYEVKPAVREGVEFQRQDLLRDSFPTGVDLILCRNVVIYFSEETKQRLFTRFYQALRPGGYLLVGSTERIYDAQAIGYVSPVSFLYQRPS